MKSCYKQKTPKTLLAIFCRFKTLLHSKYQGCKIIEVKGIFEFRNPFCTKCHYLIRWLFWTSEENNENLYGKMTKKNKWIFKTIQLIWIFAVLFPKYRWLPNCHWWLCLEFYYFFWGIFALHSIQNKDVISKNISGCQTLFAKVTQDSSYSDHNNWGITVPGTDWLP